MLYCTASRKESLAGVLPHIVFDADYEVGDEVSHADAQLGVRGGMGAQDVRRGVSLRREARSDAMTA